MKNPDLTLAFVVNQVINEKTTRKFVFESQDKTLRGSLLGGAWEKKTLLSRGLLDGKEITAPYALPLRKVETPHGAVLRPQGVTIKLEGATIEPVLDAQSRPVIGGDGKPVSNVRGGTWVVITHTLASGETEDWAVASPDVDSDLVP